MQSDRQVERGYYAGHTFYTGSKSANVSQFDHRISKGHLWPPMGGQHLQFRLQRHLEIERVSEYTNRRCLVCAHWMQ
jgi:hypothetical protein